MSSDLVVVSTRSFGSGRVDTVAMLQSVGLDVRTIDPTHRLDRVGTDLAEAVAWIAGAAPVTAAHLERAPRLRLLARYGVGVDAVDLSAAADRGVIVTNTPGANAEAVADHTVGLMLAALRNTAGADRAVRADDWSRRLGRELGSCRVGIVGYGTIGRAVRRRLSGFGCEVVAHDPFVTEADVPLLSLAQVVESSDVLTLHLPGGAEPLIDSEQIARMPAGAVIVNTARGDLLDEAAVADALRSGQLGACAVDVLSAELGAGASPLLEAPNVTITPHIAGQTVEAIDRMGEGAVRECIGVLVDGTSPHHPVIDEKEQP